MPLITILCIILLTSFEAFAADVTKEFLSSSIYSKMNSWQETMLAARSRIIPLIDEEKKALSSIKLGVWHSSGSIDNGHFSDVTYPGAAPDFSSKHLTDNQHWTKQENWTDDQIIFFRKGPKTRYLIRTISTDRARKIAAYIGAEKGTKVWLNGQEIFAEDKLGIRRKYLQKIPLTLRQGENELIIAVFKGNSWMSGFYFSVHQDYSYRVWEQIEKDFPVQWDWVTQDGDSLVKEWFENDNHAEVEQKLIQKAINHLGQEGNKFQVKLNQLIETKVSPNGLDWLNLYNVVCEQRRSRRLQPLLDKSPKFIFTKHHNIGGTHYAYTEAQSDAQRERCFNPGSALSLFEMNGLYGTERTLISDPTGFIRDPDVSLNTSSVLFSWKKSDREDDFHLYEMDVNSRDIKQLTSGLGFADYEGAYLPNGDVIFNSTRCVQTVDCWWTEVSNIYTCDREGNYLRRLTFDQVHTNFPTVMPDGRVIYTRWEYNDRGHGRVQPLFQMNPDGTAQTEFYGNNSWFPNSILHARGIPGSQQVIAIAGGHHSRQSGKVILIDPVQGRQENSGAQLIAPVRETKAENIDAYGQYGEQFQYPYPVNQNGFLVAYEPVGWARKWYGDKLLFGSNYYFQSVQQGLIYEDPPLLRFKVYYMSIDGQRELLVADPNLSCNQPIPFTPREIPNRPNLVDYSKKYGTYYLQDIYTGPGLKGIPRGSIKKLRIVALEYRAAGIGENVNRGPAGGAIVSTPIAIGNGSWDVKVVLGSATVYEDGSAFFSVPARKPVYFQALDENGHVVQSMRSWSTLQPGETFSCVGCHESKNQAPPAIKNSTIAMKIGPQKLMPFYGPPRGFSFQREIQPILDKNCISCHNDRSQVTQLMAEANRQPLSSTTTHMSNDSKMAFSLLGNLNSEYRAGRKWTDSYLALTHSYVRPRGNPHILGEWDNELVNWISPQSIPPMISAFSNGAARSRLISMLEAGHQGVRLSQEDKDKIACWIDLLVPYCGDYTEANIWNEPGMENYTSWFADDHWSENDPAKRYQYFIDKRIRMEEIERLNIKLYVLSNKRGL